MAKVPEQTIIWFLENDLNNIGRWRNSRRAARELRRVLGEGDAAVAIQTAYRGWRSRRQTAMKLILRELKEVLHNRDLDKTLMKIRQEKAVKIIQKWYRKTASFHRSVSAKEDKAASSGFFSYLW